MKIKELEYFYFIKNLDIININNLKKFKSICFIYSYTKNSELKKIIELQKFCKRNQIKLYISNYMQKLNQIKIDGIHISSYNKSILLNKKNGVDIIGTAHNQLEFYTKKKQGCTRIFLSPLFKTKKYSDNKILKINKFNLISKNWENRTMALGGIREKNLNQIILLNVCGIGGVTLFK